MLVNETPSDPWREYTLRYRDEVLLNSGTRRELLYPRSCFVA